MFSFLKHSNFLSSRVLSGVEITTGNTPVYSYCQIKNYYGSISIKKTGALINNLEELNQLIGKNKAIPFSPNPPICLAVTGKQVLIKSVIADEEEEDNIILQKALPGAKSDRFYVQKYWNHTGWMVAVIKKEVLDDIIDQFVAVGLDCIEVILGPFATLPLVETSQHLPHYTLTHTEKGYTVTQQQNEVGKALTIENESIDFQNIIAFSSALQSFSKDPNIELCSTTTLTKTQQEVKFNIYQIAVLRLFFILVLFITLTNYFLGQKYEEAYAELKEQTSDQQAKFSLYEQKQSELNQQINILKTTGVSSYNSFSIYADQIAALTPRSIALLELNIGLIENKLKAGEKLKIKKNEIYIKGIAEQSIQLKEFILKLEQEKWIAESIIQNYSQSDREHPGLFEIKITLHE